MSSQGQDATDKNTQDQNVSDTTPAWIKKIDDYYDNLEKNYVDKTSEFSKIFTTLNGIYVSILVFLGLSSEKILYQFPLIYKIGFLLPIVFWCIGMYHFLQVQAPYLKLCRPGDYFCYKRAISESTRHKAEHYRKGIFFSSVGIFLMFVPIIAGSFFMSVADPFPQNSQVELIIDGSYSSIIKDSQITFYNNTNKTIPLTLVIKTDDYYRVKKLDGDTLNIPIAWVKMAIIKK